MAATIPFDKVLGSEFPSLRNMEEIAAFERTPYSERVAFRNTYEILQNGAAINPEKTAIYFLQRGDAEEEPVTVSYRQFLGRITQTANLLHELGIGPGDVVSFLLPLLPQTYFVLFGAQAAGIVNPVNPLLEPGQIAEILRAAGTKVLVALGPLPETEIWQKVEAIRGDLPNLKAVLQVLGPGDEKEGVLAYDALIDRYPADRLVSGREIAPEELVAYFHTGGTTGLPKLAKHTHANHVYQVWAQRLAFRLNPELSLIAGLPLFHVGGAITQGLNQFACGVSLVVATSSGFRNPAVIRNYWRLVEKYRAASVSGVPTVLSALLTVPTEGVDLSSLMFVGVGGSGIPLEVGRAMEQKIGKKMLEVYGMTETSSILTMGTLEGDVPLGSVGLPWPYSRVRVVKLDGEEKFERECATEEIGVVLMKGPGVFSGYVEDVHNKNAFVGEGWVNSGDLGRLDDKGQLWITGRAKDTIIRGGHNIDPIVIEEALHQHPAIELAAAVGKPDGYAGELPVAYVQLKPDAAATPEELLAFARGRIPERAAIPHEMFILEALPLTPEGKIFKPELRWDAARREFAAVLAPLAEDGVQVTVSVGSDRVHGSLATIALKGAGDRTVAEAKIAELLAPYVLRYRVEWK